MLVGERMSYPVVTSTPDTPINEALAVMKREHIRRMPVVSNGKMVGIVSDHDLLYASPSPATTLSVWEMNYLLSKVTVKDVMSKNVLCVTEDTPIEEAARIMADNKVGGLPVVRDDQPVGIITETDLFKIFLELMGAREKGVRVSVLMSNKPGQLARLSEAIAKQGGNFIAFGTFKGDDPSNMMLTFKVANLDQSEVQGLVEPLVEKLLDIRII